MEASERNRLAYDRWSTTYDVDRPPHTYLEERFVSRLIETDESDVVLDAACGTGRWAQIFVKSGARVHACDISSNMLFAARIKLPSVEFLQVDLNETLPYESAQFTKAICSLAIRHVENLDRCLEEFSRILKPGGSFVFSLIHPEMDWTTYKRSNPPPIELNDEGQIFPYSQDEIRRALQSTGLTLTSITEIYADASIRHLLSAESYQHQVGHKYVLVFACERF